MSLHGADWNWDALDIGKNLQVNTKGGGEDGSRQLLWVAKAGVSKAPYKAPTLLQERTTNGAAEGVQKGQIVAV